MDYQLKLPMKIFWAMMSPFTKAWMQISMHPVIENRLPADLKPPYLLISNHVTVYDGLIVVLYSKHLPVSVFDDIQRTDIFKRLIFQNAGVIFKPVGVADPLVVRKMIKARDDGRSILLYPEGAITWDGDLLPLEMNFARLVRLLGIPVVLAKFKGGYVKQPNWSNINRSGGCKVEFSLLATREQIKGMNDEQLLSYLRQGHAHSEIDWLDSPEGSRFKYSTKSPSKGLEHLLYCCPSCHAFNSMTTFDPDAISCSCCGYTAGVDARLRLSATEGKLVFDDIRSWYKWQKQFWFEEIVKRAAQGGDILKAECPKVSEAKINGSKMVKIGHGPAYLRNDGVHFSLDDSKEGMIPLEGILACHSTKFSANRDYQLTIRTKESFILLQLTEPNLPVLAWEQAIKALQAQKRQ